MILIHFGFLGNSSFAFSMSSLKSTSFPRFCQVVRIRISCSLNVAFSAFSTFIQGTISKFIKSFKRKVSGSSFCQIKVKNGFGFFPSKINLRFVRYHVPTVNARLTSQCLSDLASTLLPETSLRITSPFSNVVRVLAPFCILIRGEINL